MAKKLTGKDLVVGGFLILVLILGLVAYLFNNDRSTEDRGMATEPGASVDLYFSPSQLTVTEGENVVMDLIAETNGGKIVAVDTKLTLANPSVVSFTGAQLNGILNQELPPQSGIILASDSVEIAASVTCNSSSTAECGAQSGQVTIAKISIIALEEGLSTIGVDPDTLVAIVDNDNNALKTLFDAEINVLPRPSPSPSPNPSPSVSPLPSPSGSPAPSPQEIPGDFTGDNQVNLDDFNLVLSKFGTTYDIFDLNLVVSNFGN